MPQPLMPKKLNLKGSVKTWRRKGQPTQVFLLGESPGWEAWWSAIYGVTQSWTRLKWLSIKTYWRRQWHPTPVFLLGRSHGRRSLVGCCPWGREELDTIKLLHFHALEKEMSTHSSVLAWRIPGTGEPGGLPSMGSHRFGHDWSELAAAAAAWRPIRLSRINIKKRCPFHHRGLECKSRKSRDIQSNRYSWSTKWSRAKANRVLSREGTGHSKHPLPTMLSWVISFTHGGVYMSTPVSQFIPTLCPQFHSLICISIPALHLGASVASFWIACICINKWHLFFSFWLTSLCMANSRSIHISTNDLTSFLFRDE